MRASEIQNTWTFIWAWSPILIPALLVAIFVLGSFIHYVETEIRYRRFIKANSGVDEGSDD